MATIPASVKAQLDSDWTGAGGAEPPYYVAEDYRTNPPLGGDSIWILDNTDTDPQVVNDKFVDEFHVIDIVVNATTADRLKEIGDEVIRILNATRILDMTYQRYKGRRNTSSVDVNNVFLNQEVIRYDMREHMKSAAAAYGAGSGPSLTQDNIEDLLMWKSANAAWVPCVPYFYSDDYAEHSSGAYAIMRNDGAVDVVFNLLLPIPTVKGTLKLYITGVRIVLFAANGTNFHSTVVVRGLDAASGTTTLFQNFTNRTAQGTYDTANAAVDCSSYNSIGIYCATETANPNALIYTAVALECYYDT